MIAWFSARFPRVTYGRFLR